MNALPTKSLLKQAFVAAALMCCAALLAWKLTPTVPLATLHGELKLEQVVPSAFGDWHIDATTATGVVNPQQEALLNQLYSQILTRTYINSTGQRIMLSIAYGKDQRDGMQLHYPEICYPAQGFQLKSNRPVDLQIAGRTVHARHLETALGSNRPEPVTYWTVIGEKVVLGGVNKKFAEMSYGFRGIIPDGLLFRISSVDRDSDAAFKGQTQFSQSLLAAIDARDRSRLIGSQE